MKNSNLVSVILFKDMAVVVVLGGPTWGHGGSQAGERQTDTPCRESLGIELI